MLGAYKKWRHERKSSREGSIASASSGEANVSVPNNDMKSPATESEREDAEVQMEQRQGPNLPLILIDEPSPAQAATVKPDSSSPSDLETSNVAMGQSAIAKAPITPPESIWNNAYEKLKAEEPKLVQGYEKVLSFKIKKELVSQEPKSVQNIIENEDASVRRAQMYQLINDGLEKTMPRTDAENTIATAMQVLNSTKSIVSNAIRDIPQAALPWAIVCVSLEILANPISQTKTNHTGIEYIGTTIEWYWEQATQIFDDSQGDHRFNGPQQALQRAFVDFYKTLLRFQMKSICNYYRHWGIVSLRDFVKLDDWDDSLNSIQEEDASLCRKITEFLNLESESHLRAIALQNKAQQRYQRMQEDQQCLRDLRITDPRADRSRIENAKGGLLQESYHWILENPQFQAWRNKDDNRLLWLSGDPGKGKTMLLCGIVQELMQQPAPSLLTFFFCQATIPTINNHIAVLRGLIWLLADQHPSLIPYIRRSYDTAGKSLFDDGNAWYALSEIFTNMLCDKELPPIYIVIDALDECITGRTELLHLIENLSTSSSVKWAVSSRNWPEIERSLTKGMSLNLEVNAALVAKAVDAYISHKASQVSILEEDDELKEEACRQMREKANGTFLWVAIVFERLNSESDAYYDETSDVLAIIDEMPEDLTDLYTVMLGRISQLKGKGPGLCRTILAITTLAYRPLHLNELATLAGFQNKLKELPRLKELIKDCGSFLTVRENNVYFIHQSAKEYLAYDHSSQSAIFPKGAEKSTHDMILNSLDVMGDTLRKNIYGLKHPGILIDDVSPPNPNPLDPILYCCTNWVAHLCDILASTDDQDLLSSLMNKEKILRFLKQHFLHWLEALALTRYLPANIIHVKQLNTLLKQKDELREFLYDASRFMQYHAQILENAPMQIYSSTLLFSPTESLVPTQRTHFSDEMSSWITSNPVKESKWSARLQTIEAANPTVVSSCGMNLLILSSYSRTVEIWDMSSGRRVQTLNHADTVYDAVFSSDSKHVVTAISGQILSWDVNSGAIIRCIDISEPDIEWANSLISNGGKFVASYKKGSYPQVYNVIEGTRLQLPADFGEFYVGMKWSNNAQFLAVGPHFARSKDLRIWDISENIPKMKLGGCHIDLAADLSFSNDSKLVAFIDRRDGGKIAIWDLSREEKILAIDTPNGEWEVVELSQDSRLIASTRSDIRHDGSRQYTVHVWDVATGQMQHTLHCGSRFIRGLAWSDDANTMAVVFYKNVEIYDLTEFTPGDSKIHDTDLVHDTDPTRKIAFSADFALVATVGKHIRIWDTATGKEVQMFRGLPNQRISELHFSQDAKSLYMCSDTDDYKALDVASGTWSEMPLPPSVLTSSSARTALSLDGSILATSFESTLERRDEIQLWKLTADGAVSHSMICHESSKILCLKFSNNAQYLAAVTSSVSITVDVWNVATGEKIWTVGGIPWAKDGTNIQCGTCRALDLQLLPRSKPKLAISDDGSTMLYTETRRHQMSILSKGKEILSLRICCQYMDPAFDVESPYILLQLGRINLDHLVAQTQNLVDSETTYDYQFLTEGYGISYDKSWITWNGKNLLWIPPDYRPRTTQAISRRCVVMEAHTGHPCIIHFSGPPPFEYLSENAT
ncbi:hypothetical protein V8C42DRAFT_331538 [Trichoderma barbatum]